MTHAAESDYIVGVYQEHRVGRETQTERKSPPLHTLLPNRDAYLTPDVDRYYAPEHAALEWDRLWTKTWLCAGRTSDLQANGSWFRFDFKQESFIIVRSDEHNIHALYNVCQHRANRLVDDPFGKTATFVCPYHSWSYDRAGHCKRVTDRELFREKALEGSLDLPSVRCETWGGFVFINMDQQAGRLAEHLGEVTDIVSGYHLDRMEVRADTMLALDCNWKTILDAFSENYHVHITHQFAMPITEDKIGQMDFYPGGHSRRIVALGNPARRRGVSEALHPMQLGLLQSVGIDPTKFQGGAQDVRRAVQLSKRSITGTMADAYADLSDNQLTDDWAINLFPNMHLSIHAEGALMMRYLPDRGNPSQCTLHITVLAHPGHSFAFYLPEAKEFEPTGRPKRQYVRHDDPDVLERIGQLLFEDIRNTRETQLGLQSRGFRAMRLSEHEQPIMYQYATMDRYLFGEETSATEIAG